MRRILPFLILLPFAACTTIQGFLSTPVSPLPAIQNVLPPIVTQAVSLPLVVIGGEADTAGTESAPASEVLPTESGFSATAEPAWWLRWQASEQDYPAEHYSLAITRPHVEPESPDNAWINREIDRIVETDIASFEEMAAQGVFDQEFPGHLWIGFSVPSAGSTGITESAEGGENTEGVLRDATPPAPQVVGVSPGDLPSAIPASQALLDLGHPVLSLLMGVSPYTGGAHPGFYHVPLTLDFTTRAPIELSDLFLPGSDYLGRLSQLAIQQLAGREYIFPETLQLTPAPEQQGFAAGAGPHPDNYRVWALSPQGLWLVFDPYQVAPWAAGPQFVLIPYAELADLLDPAGPLGFVSREGG